MKTTAEQRRASSVDPIAHSSVQPWSAGEIFPFVMVCTEHYPDNCANGHWTYKTWQAINGPRGWSTAVRDSYEAAHAEARHLLELYARTAPVRAAWDGRVSTPACAPVLADGLVAAEMGVMCGGDAEATATANNEARIEAIPRLAREFVDLTPEARSRLMEKSRQELFAHMEANPEDQTTVLE